MKAKKIIIALMSFVILLTSSAFVWADEVEESVIDLDIASYTIDGITYLSLDEAIAIGLENNRDLRDAEIDAIFSAQDLEDAQESADAVADAFSFSGVLGYSVMTGQEYTTATVLSPLAYEALNTANELMVEMLISSTSLSIESSYNSLVLAGTSEGLSYESLLRVREQLAETELLYSLGMASRLEVLQAEYSETQALAELNTARAETWAAKRALADVMGIDINTNISPTTALEMKEVDIDFTDEYIEEMIASNLVVQITQYNLEAGRIMYEYDARIYETFTQAYKDAVLNIEILDLQEASLLASTEISMRDSYDQLVLAAENYANMTLAVELSEESYRLTLLQYEQGMATLSELNTAEGNLKDAEYGQLSLLYAYNVMALQFEMNLF